VDGVALLTGRLEPPPAFRHPLDGLVSAVLHAEVPADGGVEPPPKLKSDNGRTVTHSARVPCVLRWTVSLGAA
jgi:hypothetical protein